MGINMTFNEKMLKETCQNCYREEMCDHKDSDANGKCMRWRGDCNYEKLLMNLKMLGVIPVAASGS